MEDDVINTLNLDIPTAINRNGHNLWKQIITKDPSQCNASDAMKVEVKYTTLACHNKTQTIEGFVLTYQKTEKQMVRYSAAHLIPKGQQRAIKLIIACKMVDTDHITKLISNILEGSAIDWWQNSISSYNKIGKKLQNSSLRHWQSTAKPNQPRSLIIISLVIRPLTRKPEPQ